jgi:hypothetical protein
MSDTRQSSSNNNRNNLSTSRKEKKNKNQKRKAFNKSTMVRVHLLIYKLFWMSDDRFLLHSSLVLYLFELDFDSVLYSANRR